MPEKELAERLERLARVIAYADPRRDARAAAERLRAVFGTVTAIYESDPRDIARTGLVSLRAARLLGLAPALLRYERLEALGPRPTLDRLSRARAYLEAAYLGVHYEQMSVLLLDGKLRLRACRVDSERLLRESPLKLRLIVSAALSSDAAALIIAHNHPGGTRHFSPLDILSTQRLLSMLALVKAPLLDHILLADDCLLSMREMAYLPEHSWLATGPLALRRALWLR